MPHLRAPWRSALLQKIAIIGMSDATLYNPWPLRRCCSRILLAGAPLGATGLYPLHGQGGTYGSHQSRLRSGTHVCFWHHPSWKWLRVSASLPGKLLPSTRLSIAQDAPRTL